MRFCEYCGAPLEDGQICTCPQAQQKQQEQSIAQPTPPVVPPQPNQPGLSVPQAGGQAYGYGQQGAGQPVNGGQQPTGGYQQQPTGYAYQPGSGTPPQGQPGGYNPQQPTGGYGYQQQPGGYNYQPGAGTPHQSLKSFFTQYLDSPVQAIHTAVKERNLTLAVGLTVFRAVVVIAILWSMVEKVTGIIHDTIEDLWTIFSFLGGSAEITVKGNPLGSIVFGLLLAVLSMALFTLMIFVLTRIFKRNNSFLDVYIANSVNGVVTTVVLVLAFLGSLFSIELGQILVVLACFSAVLFGGVTVRVMCGNQEKGSFWLCYLAGIAVVLLVSWWLVPTLVMQAVGGISVSIDGEFATIREILERLEDVEVSDIFSGMFGSMFY